ncbi:hypothetical protein [Pleomorphovibrio marinus]|uniref:hypothetical protein n=1 Tax=Pleomorphovibrio marinus TaxID=2164132 RepID=UPI000E09E383|nr:hypothetical protein [Pleomorphovibrio marinus]
MKTANLNLGSPTTIFYFTNGDSVDKGSNRKSPGTSGEGPRPPQKKDFPDKKKKDKQEEEVDNEKRDKNKK